MPKEPKKHFFFIAEWRNELNLELTIALSNGIGLDVSVVVLASPDKASLGLYGVGDHVVDESVLVPNALGLELWLVLTTKIFN
jgi:hypothetical protein